MLLRTRTRNAIRFIRDVLTYLFILSLVYKYVSVKKDEDSPIHTVYSSQYYTDTSIYIKYHTNVHTGIHIAKYILVIRALCIPIVILTDMIAVCVAYYVLNNVVQ
jgi:hypothetical protein